MKKLPTTNMQKCSMRKPKTDIKTLEGQQKEIQYPGWHKDTTGKGLWSVEDNSNTEWESINKSCGKYKFKLNRIFLGTQGLFVQTTKNIKWNWAGHVQRLQDN